MLDSLDIVRPADAGDLREIVADAAANRRALEIRGGGSKRHMGRPGRETCVVDVSNLSGIVDYEPSELVLTARPATLLTDIESLLASRGQMLAFEPWDHGPLFDASAGKATIGGIVAAGISGSRRVSAGAARDHLLGFSAVSGRAELFKGGGKVVKNVTGYDVSKVMTGSWGQLAVMTELTLKVLPIPKSVVTVRLEIIGMTAAIHAMSKAFGSPASPAAAAHLPNWGRGGSITAIRIEGFTESIAARAKQLIADLADFAPAQLMEEQEAEQLWMSVRDVRALSAEEALWRVHVAPSRAAALTDALDRSGATWISDWAGALVWVGAPANVEVRGIAEFCGAHAMLVRGPAELRIRTSVRQSGSTAVAALGTRLKQTFDPADILDPRRFD